MAERGSEEDEVGRTVIPQRYAGGGREKIDQIRDSLGDAAFRDYCRGQAMRYERDAEGQVRCRHDEAKRDWYLQMEGHVVAPGSVPDPRSERPDFRPYDRVRIPDAVGHPRIEVLGGQGWVRLVETWGIGDARISEAGIVEAARMSTQGTFRGWRRDEALLTHLYNNKHASPFEFCGFTLEGAFPIFVLREWHRHRTQSYGEASARYGALPAHDYLPSVDDVVRRSLAAFETRNRQAGLVDGAPAISREAADHWIRYREEQYRIFQSEYEEALRNGVPKELARIGMPVGRFSTMRATANLRNWLGFLALRLHPAAQEEIREYADAVGQIVAAQFPKVWGLFNDPREPSETDLLRARVAALEAEVERLEGANADLRVETP